MSEENLNPAQLSARWHAAGPDGAGSRRDTTLALLRRVCVKGSAERPATMDLRGINLAGEDLSGLDLSGYGLEGAELSNANLRGANLSRAHLDNATLHGAGLANCEFLGARMTHVNLDECKAARAGFAMADLTCASLLNADFNHASFSRAILNNADLSASNLEEASIREANLTNAAFTRANLQGADLKESDVQGATFHLADLRGARPLMLRNYMKAYWVGADIRDMDLRGAYMIRRHIMDENYLFEFRGRSKLNYAIYWIWWITSDCGRSFVRWSVVVLAFAVFFALCYMAVGIDYGRHPTVFSPFYFSVVTMATLGYGDAMPASVAGQVLAITEAMVGYVGLGGMLSILANKMARRAE